MLQNTEPIRTIYTEDWVRGRSELEKLVSQKRAGPFGFAFAQLEEAWEHVRPLEAWCESREHAPGMGETEDAIRWHVEVEVVDLFRWIANETVHSIPRPNRKQTPASVDDLETEVEALRRNVRMLLLAVESEAVPTSVRALAQRHAVPLVDWSVTFGATVTAVRRHLDTAGDGEEHEQAYRRTPIAESTDDRRSRWS